MSSPSHGLLSVWRSAWSAILRRPLPFLAASLALSGTNVMLWRMGVYEGAARGETGGAALASFLLTKLIVLLAWGLAAMRLVDDPRLPAAKLLRIDRRQAAWLGGMLLMLPLLLTLRISIAKAVGALLAPFAPDPRAAAATALLLYLAASLGLLVRILPGWAGVMIGDREAGLAWSWRASRGQALRSIGLLFAALLPAGAVHFGNNLLWLSKLPALRAATLLADGAIMALYVAIAAAAYVSLHRRAKAAAGN